MKINHEKVAQIEAMATKGRKFNYFSFLINYVSSFIIKIE